MHLGKNIKYFRKKAGLSVADLAVKTGYNIEILEELEEAKNPDHNALQKVCQALSITTKDVHKRHYIYECEVNITINDVLLFKYLLEDNFLTREQIYKFVYPYNETYVRQRLARLVRCGYIEKLKSPLGKLNETILVPKHKAVEALFAKQNVLLDLKRDKAVLHFYDPNDYFIPAKLDMRQLSHDAELNTIRFMLEDAGAEDWQTQKMIYKRVFKHNPDGLFHKKGRLFAVEYENTLKREMNYKEILKFYTNEKKISFVIYIIGSISILRSLQKLMNSRFIGCEPDYIKKIWLVKYSDMIAGNFIAMNPLFEQSLDLRDVLKWE